MPIVKPGELPRWEEAAGNQGVPGGTEVDPSSGKKDVGWLVGEKPPAQYMNWWQRLVYDWIQWLNDLTNQALTWAAVQTFQGATSIIAKPSGVGVGVFVTMQGNVSPGTNLGIDVDAGEGQALTQTAIRGRGSKDGTGVLGQCDTLQANTGVGVEGRGGVGTGTGVKGTGGNGGGLGGAFFGVSGSDAAQGTGDGAGTGLKGTGGLTGVGVKGIGGATSGDGGVFTGTNGNANGLSATGQGSGAGVNATGGANGNGVTGTGQGIGYGVLGTGGATGGEGVFGQGTGAGAGVHGVGGATNGVGGIFRAGATNAIGLTAQGAGTEQGAKFTAGTNVNASSKGAINLAAQNNLVAGAGAGCVAGDVAWNGTNFLVCKANGTWTVLI